MQSVESAEALTQEILIRLDDRYAAMFVRIWRPAGTPRATVFCLHGFTGNGADFDYLAAFLCRNGFLVICEERSSIAEAIRARTDVAGGRAHRGFGTDALKFKLAMRQKRWASGRVPRAASIGSRFRSHLAASSLPAYKNRREARRHLLARAERSARATAAPS